MFSVPTPMNLHMTSQSAAIFTEPMVCCKCK